VLGHHKRGKSMSKQPIDIDSDLGGAHESGQSTVSHLWEECHISGKNVTLSHTKIFVELVTFFVTSFPKNFTFWHRRYKTFLNGKKCDDSAWTEKCITLPVSDFSHISEA